MKYNWHRVVITTVLAFAVVVAHYAYAQEDFAREAERLNGQAVELYKAARYEDAIPLARRALAIREQNLGHGHLDTAESLSTLALVCEATGAYPYAEAEALYQRALAIREKVLGFEHRDTAESLNDLAALYDSMGAYAKAEPLYQRALAILEKVFGFEHPDLTRSLNELAELYRATGAYAKAELLHLRALAINEKFLGQVHPDIATSINNLAGIYESTGAYAKAGLFYQRALAISEKALGSQHPITATLLNNVAGIYQITGEYEKAEPIFQRALAIRETVLGPEHPYTANSLHNLAGIYQSTGAYTKAELLYQRALAIREKTLGPEHPGTASSLNKLALLYQRTGAYSKAEPLYQRALAIYEMALGAEHPDTAKSLNNLAVLYSISAKYAQSDPLFERARAIDERNAISFLLSGSESRKLQYMLQRTNTVSMDISLSMINPTARSTALGLSSVLQYKGRVLDVMSGSLARLRRSVAPEDRALLDRLSAVAQELSRLTYRGPENPSAEAYRERLDALAQQQDALQMQLASRSAAFSQTVTPITLNAVRQALPPDAVLVEWLRYEPFDAKAEASARRRAPHYVGYMLKRTGELAAIDVGEAGPIEDLIVRFRDALLDPTTGARGASRLDSRRGNVKLLAAQLSEKLIKPLRPHISQSERLLISPDGALNLIPFAALLDERGEYLAQHFEISYLTSGRDLLRMADAPSNGESVVLAAPTYGEGGSTRLLSEAALQPMRSAEFDRSGLVFNPLPGTAAEARALQSLLGLDPHQLLTGDRATEAQLRSLHGPRILHLATHGFFLEDEDVPAIHNTSFALAAAAAPLRENPLLRSGLALAGANQRSSGDADDGILTAAEVAQLNLVGTQLVVLSACETALGTVDAGEGVYGLRRALVLAGAQSQLVSLWKVDDAATQTLMTEYYQRLLKGEGRAAALRAVQLAMLADPVLSHPYYWGAFIPIGDWTPLGK